MFWEISDDAMKKEQNSLDGLDYSLFISNMLCILVQMTLEEAIGYVASDELIEVHFPIM